MKAHIFLNGEIQDYSSINVLIKESETIICADGGTVHVDRLHRTPQIIIGDLDSTPKSLVEKFRQRGCKVIQYDPEKNYTDSELTVQYAIDEGFDEIYIYGMFGSRVDHSLATLLFLAKLVRDDIKIVIVQHNQTLHLITNSLRLLGEKGDTVSLVPLADCTGLSLKGFQYPLYVENLPLGTTRGVSNVLMTSDGYIELQTGKLLVIHTKNLI